MGSSLIVLLGCAVAWLLWSRVNSATLRDSFSPFNLLFYFWVLPFLASYMQLSDLQSGLSPQATLLIIGCTLLLIATTLLPILILRGEPLIVRCAQATALLRRRAWLVVAFYAATLAALYFAEFYGRDLPLFAYLALDADSSTLHTFGKDSKLQVLAFGIHVATMLVFSVGLNVRSVLLKIMAVLLVIVVVLVGFLKAAKTDVYIPILVCAALYYYHRKRRGAKLPTWWKALGVALGLLVISLTSIRIRGTGWQTGYADAIQFRYSEELGPVLSELVSIVYGYTSLAFQNLSNYMALSDGELRLGTSLFRPVLSMLMQGELADSLDVPVDKWGVVSDAANTGTYLTPLYVEAGAGGCLLASLLYGLLVNVAYVKFRRRGGAWMFVYVSLIFPWTWLFFTNAFSVLGMYTNLFYVAMFFIVWTGRPNVAREASVAAGASGAGQ